MQKVLSYIKKNHMIQHFNSSWFDRLKTFPLIIKERPQGSGDLAFSLSSVLRISRLLHCRI